MKRTNGNLECGAEEHPGFQFLKYFKLEVNCFTMLCWLLPYNKVNQPQVHMSSSSRTPPPPTPPGCHKAPGILWQPVLYRSFPLAICFTRSSVYICKCYCLNLSHPLLPLCPKSVLCVCVSIPALKIGSSVPFFSRFCIYALIYKIFLFLTLLCITGSRFIHLIRTDSNVFLFMAK